MFSGEVNFKNICRCCHSNGCFKNITTEYYHSGHKEIYENMLRETFNINILRYNRCTEISRLICESCILNLRAALAFKNMVIACETRLANFVETSHSDDKDVKKEIEDVLIKTEVCEDGYDGNDFVGVQMNDILDDDKDLKKEIEDVLIKTEVCEDGYDGNDFVKVQMNDILYDDMVCIIVEDEIETKENFNEAGGEMEGQNLEESKNELKRKKVDCDKDVKKEIEDVLIKSEVCEDGYDGNDFVGVQMNDILDDDKDLKKEIEDVLIKTEVCEDGYDGNDFVEVQMNDILDDDMVCIIVEDEIETKENFNEACGEMEGQNLEDSKNELKRKKVDCDTNNKNNWIEWNRNRWKIAERRRITPILRENSLKLLSNSTMVAFQWNKGWWACFICKESFMEMSALKEHYKEHSIKCIEKKMIMQRDRLLRVEVSSLNCKKCKIKCETIQDLREHLIEKHQIKFDIQGDLLIPFKIQTDGFKCQICSETFTVFRLLNFHINRHYKNHVCHICGASFANLVILNLHTTQSHGTDKKNHSRLEHVVL